MQILLRHIQENLPELCFYSGRNFYGTPAAAKTEVYNIMENKNDYTEALNALRREYDERLAEKEAECALLRGEKKAKDDELAKIREDNNRYLEEYVAVKLFKDNDRYHDDVYVAVNGKNCIIKRGEWVRIKRKFALVLDQSEIQDMKTAEMIEAEQRKFFEESENKDGLNCG